MGGWHRASHLDGSPHCHQSIRWTLEHVGVLGAQWERYCENEEQGPGSVMLRLEMADSLVVEWERKLQWKSNSKWDLSNLDGTPLHSHPPEVQQASRLWERAS